MGSLTFPRSGTVYVDANCVIYPVEKIPPYDSMLDPLWRAASARSLSILSSEMIVCETLVRPIRDRKPLLEEAFRSFLVKSREFRLVPIRLATLERAAGIRAETGLKTPDAIHAATAIEIGATVFLTNDPGFRRVKELEVAVLSEVAGP
ncbi:MAG: type II toxin-antitoxin system VapC family toxin [Phycisphaerales bacterium]|nr:type II toxin-antitoxin system VapC family toxin [Phycisphaerales bacterium]